MRVLLLGGTAFVGRHAAEAFLARGHQVTLFHRGLTDPRVFPDAEHVLGDRERDIGKLAGERFDAVIDTCGYEVPAVRASVQAVAHPDLHYLFVSSVSVYADLSRMEESGPLLATGDPETERLSKDNYGALKAACERVVMEAMPGRAQIVRAGLILGPYDYDERFPWWLRRVARGGTVLAPGDPAAPVQLIDVRDFASWIVHSAERRLAGTFNATGPDQPLTMRALLETIRQVVGGDARFTWVDDELLVAEKVAPYSEMPFWLPASLGYRPVDASRAVAAGLSHRPLADTVSDTWTWLATGSEAAERARAHRKLRVPAGLSPERESELLAAARARSAAIPGPDRRTAARLGRETMRILEAGTYQAPSGRTVSVARAVETAVAGTRSYPPDAVLQPPARKLAAIDIEVTSESTLSAARRLDGAGVAPLALNFASAKNPGGGFLSGARAQEESLARASALHACLLNQPMYELHRSMRDPIYSSWAIYSPSVPVFRDDEGNLLETRGTVRS